MAFDKTNIMGLNVAVLFADKVLTPEEIQLISKIIYETAIADKMPPLLASFLVGQSKFETNKYLNKHCRLHNAMFSYMYDKNSKWQVPGGGTLADNGAPVAKYKDVEDSVHEMTAWVGRRQKQGKFPADLTRITTADQYSRLLYSCGFYQGWKRYTKEQNIDFYTNGIDRYKESF